VIDQGKIDAQLNDGKSRINRRKNQLPYNFWEIDNIKTLRGLGYSEVSKFRPFILPA
jgi:hypothetical protein